MTEPPGPAGMRALMALPQPPDQQTMLAIMREMRGELELHLGIEITEVTPDPSALTPFSLILSPAEREVLAVAATLIAPRGLWGFAADRFGWSLLPVGHRVRQPRA